MTEHISALERSNLCIAFVRKHMEHRSAIRKKSKALNANLLTAHQLAFSAVISYQDRIQGRQYEATDPSIRGRMSLIAQFVQGVDITEVAISEGLYANAANLLKQELEILVAIDEYQAGKRRDGRSPNVRNILSRFYNRYSEFNNLAHPTRQEILESLSTFSDGEHYGPTTIPRFNAELYHILYGNQAMFLVMIFARMRTVFREVFDMDWDDEETRIITSALRILVDEGIVEEQGEA